MSNSPLRLLLVIALAQCLILSTGCQSNPPTGAAGDSGPSTIPAAVLNQPDPIPRDEALSASGNSASYVVFGETYYRLPTSANYSATGVASWYGRKFHGRLTASGETYDMYALTAAHRSLPLPTYVRVTNLGNQKSVVVRVNDRGPFVDDRLIDLSYGAAAKLDMIDAGTARVKVVGLSSVPGDSSQGDQRAQNSARPAAAPAALPYRVPTPILGTAGVSRPDASQLNTTEPTAELRDHAASATSDYLQVGAFSSIDAAQRLSVQLKDLVGEIAVGGSRETDVFITQQPADSLYRVRLGPFDTLAGAVRVSERIQTQLRLIPVWVN